MAETAHPLDHDAALLAVALGDRAALRRLYEAEAPRLLGLARRIVKRGDLAQDVVHDAFVQIWSRAGSFDPRRGSGRSWIYAVVRHRALNLVRDSRFETELDPAIIEEEPDTAPEPIELLQRMAESEALRRCLEQLEPQRRDCLLMAYSGGLSHVQIAERTGSPLGTVKTWIRRALLTLRDCLA